MSAMLWWLVQNSLAVAVLVAIVWLLCRLLENRPAVQHALWLVVLIKFMTPPIVSWPWSAGEIIDGISSHRSFFDADNVDRGLAGNTGTGRSSQAAASPVSPDHSSIAGDPALPYSDLSFLADGQDANAGSVSHLTRQDQLPSTASEARLPTAELAHTPSALSGSAFEFSEEGGDFSRSSRSRMHEWPGVVGWVVLSFWLLGCGIAAAVQGTRIARHHRTVRQAVPASPNLVGEVRSVAQAMDARSLPVFVVGGIASPFLWCFGWLRLIWPEELSSEEKIGSCRGLIAHELAHAKRRDHWVAWLELAAACLWWWNPLFWYVRRRLRETADLACDAAALDTLPNAERGRYAELFLELSQGIQTNRVPAPVLGVSAGTRRSVERRLKMILNEGVSCKASATEILAVALLAFVALPAWSLGEQLDVNNTTAFRFRADEPPEAALRFQVEDPRDGKGTDDGGTQPGDAEPLQAEQARRAEEAARRNEAEARADQKTRDAATWQADGMAEKLQQVRADFREMRGSGKVDVAQLHRAQRVLAELREYMRARKGSEEEMIREMYLHVLGRRPTDAELATARELRPGFRSPEDFFGNLVFELAGKAAQTGGAQSQNVDRTEVQRRIEQAQRETQQYRELLQAAQQAQVRAQEAERRARASGTGDADAASGSEQKQDVADTPARKEPGDAEHLSKFQLNQIEELIRLLEQQLESARARQAQLREEQRLLESRTPAKDEADKRDSQSSPPTGLGGGVGGLQRLPHGEPQGAPQGLGGGGEPQNTRHGLIPSETEQLDLVSLAVSYLDAVGELKLARARYSRLKKEEGAVPKGQIEEAAIRLETAERKAKVFAAILKDAHEAAVAHLRRAEWLLAQYETVYATGKVSLGEMADKKEQVESAKTRLKHLQSLLTTATAQLKKEEIQLDGWLDDIEVEVHGKLEVEPQDRRDRKEVQPATEGKQYREPTAPEKEMAEAPQVDFVKLAVSYLDAVGELKLARARYSRLRKQEGAVPNGQIEEAAITLETAERKAKVLARILRDTHQAAAAELRRAQDELARYEGLHQDGYVSKPAVALQQQRVQSVQAKLKHLESLRTTIKAGLAEQEIHLDGWLDDIDIEYVKPKLKQNRIEYREDSAQSSHQEVRQ